VHLGDESLGKGERPDRGVERVGGRGRREVLRKADQSRWGGVGSCSLDQSVRLTWTEGVAGDDNAVDRVADASDCFFRALDRDFEALFFKDGFTRVKEHLVCSDEKRGA